MTSGDGDRLDPLRLADRLATQAGLFTSLLTGVTVEQVRWRPNAGSWSLLEVINHLADEEVEDFRFRLDLALHQPSTPWPAIDPERWARERGYGERDHEASLERFLDERERSVTWLRSLPPIDPAAAGLHPRLGPIRAGVLMASWHAHDLIHVRQLTRLHYRFLEASVGPDAVAYAGAW